jgi:DNA-directed RNA polymerase omega subunit
MIVNTTAKSNAENGININEEWPGIVSRFQLVILAGLRSKQLLHGRAPRIVADPLKRKNTSIALEELRQGRISFSGLNGDGALAQETALAVIEA